MGVEGRGDEPGILPILGFFCGEGGGAKTDRGRKNFISK